ncbi:MAG TPA: Ig-like domain-containing protein [Thermoanaerobaculia bacterium]|nr:Ig-like domain-containing protein [Thermoanaerobaculia bacterium]
MTRKAPSPSGRFRLAAAVLAVLLLAACRPKAVSLEANPRRLTIYGTEQSKEIAVRAVDSKGTSVSEMPPLKWTSSDTTIVQVSGSGHVEPKRPGKATVTVSAGNLSASVAVEVVDLSKIELAPALLRLVGPAGTVSKLEVTGKNSANKPATIPAVAWIVTDPKVASVRRDGTVESRATGKTIVTARVGDLVAESEIQIDVRNVSRIELRPETAILRVGESQKLSVTAYDENGLPIADAGAQLAASAPEIVRVLGDGTITGLKPGTAVVTAAVGDRRAQATVLVD